MAGSVFSCNAMKSKIAVFLGLVAGIAALALDSGVAKKVA